jgi:hypothetical protein
MPLALAITIATAWVSPATDERALYGLEGPIEQNWLPRAVAGWPAPYLADDPDTSVIHKVGPEDNFRLGAFAATLELLDRCSINCPELGSVGYARSNRETAARARY